MIEFVKMEGLGNDYIYIDCFKNKILEKDIYNLAIKLSDRHFGIGSDGLVLIMEAKHADFRMRMFNADGTEAEMCGNAIRCVGKYVYDEGYIDKEIITIETLAGIKILNLNIHNSKVKSVKVDMGEPILKSDKIPVISNNDEVINEKIIIDNKEYYITCISVGNPHCVVYIEDLKNLDIQEIGYKFENNKIFPKRINTEFVKIIDKNTVEMRVWERGAGETLACGTGASAVVVASVLNDFTERKVIVKLLGGDLELEWCQEDNHIYMTGPAKLVFKGVIENDIH